ncbi:TPA: hypothetical protein RJ955_004542 [Enterobacter hormaechei]|nr:hypothetical protein [Enterobacter hormaechei]HDV8215688.1 hypothetical protein [Enterobacter hormaechei]
MFGLFKKKKLYEEICEDAGIALSDGFLAQGFARNKLEAMGAGAVFSRSLKEAVSQGYKSSDAITEAKSSTAHHLAARGFDFDSIASAVDVFCVATGFESMLDLARKKS